jgi:hypothetical protein
MVNQSPDFIKAEHFKNIMAGISGYCFPHHTKRTFKLLALCFLILPVKMKEVQFLKPSCKAQTYNFKVAHRVSSCQDLLFCHYICLSCFLANNCEYKQNRTLIKGMLQLILQCPTFMRRKKFSREQHCLVHIISEFQCLSITASDIPKLFKLLSVGMFDKVCF